MLSSNCTSRALHRIAQSAMMNELRRKKSTASVPIAPPAGERMVLRSRSGRVVTEEALSEAVQRATNLNAPTKRCAVVARGLDSAADANLQHVGASAEIPDKAPPKRHCRGNSARVGAAQPPSGAAAAPVQSTTAGADACGPGGTAQPALTLAASPAAWTEASMASALEHLCKADSREAPLHDSTHASLTPLQKRGLLHWSIKNPGMQQLVACMHVCSAGAADWGARAGAQAAADHDGLGVPRARQRHRQPAAVHPRREEHLRPPRRRRRGARACLTWLSGALLLVTLHPGLP